MNPGKVVAPARLDEHLRLGGSMGAAPSTATLHFAYPEDGGSFVEAATRCVGVGKCRQHSHEGGAVMCPSYQATMEEEHSTRGRARLLFEMLRGHPDSPINDGWRSTAVRDALDLCLACKGCKTDCPVNVDMATYKAEFLAHHYAGPAAARARTTRWAGCRCSPAPCSRARLGRCRQRARPRAAAAARWPRARPGSRTAEIPLFAGETLQQWWTRRRRVAARARAAPCCSGRTRSPTHFHPHIGQAAVELLEAAGWTVRMPDRAGVLRADLDLDRPAGHRQEGAAPDGRRAGRARPRRRPGARAGAVAAPRCSAPTPPDLLPGRPGRRAAARADGHAGRTAARSTRPAGRRPRLQGVAALAQVHCHHHAVLDDWDADQDLLHRAGADTDRLESGCCGLAGNFGFEKGHLDVSRACAESVLLPALRDADPDAVVLADGFSCRTQIHELDSGGREAVHLAELLDARAAARAGHAGRRDLADGDRPRPPARGAGGCSAAVARGAAQQCRGMSRGARRRQSRQCRPRCSSASPRPSTPSRRRSPRPTAP